MGVTHIQQMKNRPQFAHKIGVNEKRRLQATVKYISTDSSLFFFCSGSESGYMFLSLFLFLLSVEESIFSSFSILKFKFKIYTFGTLQILTFQSFLDRKVETFNLFTMKH